MDQDEKFKRLINELGQAINESISESEKISEAMARIRAAGYDLFLALEVTIGFNKRNGRYVVHRERLDNASETTTRTHRYTLTNGDAQFLRAMKISVDPDDQ